MKKTKDEKFILGEGMRCLRCPFNSDFIYFTSRHGFHIYNWKEERWLETKECQADLFPDDLRAYVLTCHAPQLSPFFDPP